MKIIKLKLILICLMLHSTSFSQFFTEGYGEKFNQMLEEGIFYVKSGNKEVDLTFISALESFWDISDFEVIESGDVTDDMLIITDYTINLSGGDKSLEGNYYSLAVMYLIPTTTPDDDYVLCRMTYDGILGRKTSLKDRLNLVPLIIQCLNSAAHIVNDNELFEKKKIYYKGVSFYDVLSKKNMNLRGLRLIIPEAVAKENFYKLARFNKLGLSYKVVNNTELLEILEQKNPNDCILHWLAYHQFATFYTCNSIIRIADGELILSEKRETMSMTPFFDSPHKVFKLAKILFKK